MKKIALLVFLIGLAGVFSTISAQTLFIAPSAESTIVGIQYGGSFGYLAKNSVSIGGFYLRGKSQSEVWPAEHIVFYGIQSTLPLVRAEKLVFSGHIRAGLANNQFVVLVPGIETRIRITSRFHTVLGA